MILAIVRSRFAPVVQVVQNRHVVRDVPVLLVGPSSSTIGGNGTGQPLRQIRILTTTDAKGGRRVNPFPSQIFPSSCAGRTTACHLGGRGDLLPQKKLTASSTASRFLLVRDRLRFTPSF